MNRLFDSCNSINVTVCVCVSTVSQVYESGHQQWFYPFLNFFPKWNYSVIRTVSQVFVSHFVRGCGPNDPYNSLHEPLTAENKTRGENTFVAREEVAMFNMKDNSDLSC